MVDKTMFRGKDAYICEECGFIYPDEYTAKKCERFCRDHSGCSMDIARKSLK